MARRVFFSFHYDDIWKVNQVRNSWMTQGGQTNTFHDSSIWEETKTKGDAAIKRLINLGMANTSVTVVLIGAKTASRTYVHYEIQRSLARKNGLLGVHIHQLESKSGWPGFLAGPNPFDHYYDNGKHREAGLLSDLADIPLGREALSSVTPAYDWVDDKGYGGFAEWIEKAASAAGR